MFDESLVISILKQIDNAIIIISRRFDTISNPNDFTDNPRGMETLDSICMQFIAIGEGLKNIDKITDNQLLSKYQGVDWKGFKGFRDVISHQYFDIDAEEVFWICDNELAKLSETIKMIINELC